MSKLSPRTDKSVWYGPSLYSREEEWLLRFTNEELEELINSSKQFVQLQSNFSNQSDEFSLELLDNFFSTQFTLPLIKEKIKDISKRLHQGIGFTLLKGLPINRLSKEETAAAFLLLGKCLGNLRQQNKSGHVLGHVKDLGLSIKDVNVRNYQTNVRNTFHTDWSDIVGLLCLHPAKSGGVSYLVSSGAIWNEMLKKDESLLTPLLKPMARDKRGEVAKGTKPYFNIPVYSLHGEKEEYLSSFYQRIYIDSAQRFAEEGEIPFLTEKEVEALNLFDKIANDPKLVFTMDFEPGDIQLLYNHTILHDRSAFVDWEEDEKKRHLLRLWVSSWDSRPLPDTFLERYGGTLEIGNRGGVAMPEVESIAPLNP